MATRTTSLESKIMEALKDWESSSESPATLQEVMGEFELSDKEAYDTLGKLEDAGKINSEGRWLTSVWFLGEAKEKTSATPAETVKPKRKRRTKAEMEAARAEAANRTAYAANVAESQDMDAQHATPRVIAPPVVPAETPVIAENGETVTVPVDYDDESKGRRELDASEGERVIAEDNMSKIVEDMRKTAPKTAVAVQALGEKLKELSAEDEMRAMILELKRENAALKAKQEDKETEETATLVFHEPKNGPCPGNEIPAIPAGVHPHTWELAHDANTETARAYYMRQVQAQIAEYEETAIAEEHMREILNNQDDVPPF